MAILHSKEHFSCLNYDTGKDSIIQKIVLKKGQNWNFTSQKNKIVLLTSGSLNFSFGEYSDRNISKGQILAFPANYNFSSEALEDSVVITMRTTAQMSLCDGYVMDNLLAEKKDDFEFDLTLLEMKDIVCLYAQSLESYLDDDFRCYYLFEMKIKEFFYLLRGYYTKDELLSFFYLTLTNDNSFSDFIQVNYHKAKTVQELADLANYSLSGFQKRFKRVFGVSAYHWMQEKRSKNILHEINNRSKSLKEISNDYGFSSPSHFNDFCKEYFGTTPGKIRKQGMTNINSF
ncbi:MAG: AraC family transcriptional regulator [Dysgonomonas sp.]